MRILNKLGLRDRTQSRGSRVLARPYHCLTDVGAMMRALRAWLVARTRIRVDWSVGSSDLSMTSQVRCTVRERVSVGRAFYR